MDVRIIDEPAITPPEDAAIRALLCVCFPADRAVFSRTRAWNGSAPAFSAVLENQGRILAHVGVVDRRIRAGGASVRVAGIQNVAVDPQHRGQKLTARTMAAAVGCAAGRRFDAGLLFCIPALEPFYHHLGWQRLPPVAITRLHNGAQTALPPNHLALFYPLAIPVLPAGDIHLVADDW